MRCASMTNRDELEWLRDRGVRIDHKGRIIVSLPTPELEFKGEELEPTIAELMRREVPRTGGSRGRRRRAPRPNLKREKPAQTDEPVQSRMGRPVIGAEARVYVHTSISQWTRQILAQRGMTLADVFDDCARELEHGS